jgi:hypothetical protein
MVILSSLVGKLVASAVARTLIGKAVMVCLKELAKSTDNKLDDDLVAIIGEALGQPVAEKSEK